MGLLVAAKGQKGNGVTARKILREAHGLPLEVSGRNLWEVY
jgi:hypothetical protein